MSYRDSMRQLAGFRAEIAQIRQKMHAVQAAVQSEQIADYRLTAADGPRSLSDLFGGKKDLFVIHNMGRSCPNCTLWADGFNGLYPHVNNRAAFVVASPDPPDIQQQFAAGRGWRFPMVSHQGTSFAADMGYRALDGGWLPGVSVFRREAGQIVRVSDTGFHPDDDFCALWSFMALLPEGVAGWRARYSYD